MALSLASHSSGFPTKTPVTLHHIPRVLSEDWSESSPRRRPSSKRTGLKNIHKTSEKIQNHFRHSGSFWHSVGAGNWIQYAREQPWNPRWTHGLWGYLGVSGKVQPCFISFFHLFPNENWAKVLVKIGRKAVQAADGATSPMTPLPRPQGLVAVHHIDQCCTVTPLHPSFIRYKMTQRHLKPYMSHFARAPRAKRLRYVAPAKSKTTVKRLSRRLAVNQSKFPDSPWKMCQGPSRPKVQPSTRSLCPAVPRYSRTAK